MSDGPCGTLRSLFLLFPLLHRVLQRLHLVVVVVVEQGDDVHSQHVASQLPPSFVDVAKSASTQFYTQSNQLSSSCAHRQQLSGSTTTRCVRDCVYVRVRI